MTISSTVTAVNDANFLREREDDRMREEEKEEFGEMA